MEQSLSRFIWDHTRREQTWILLVVLVSMIPYYMAFDLPADRQQFRDRAMRPPVPPRSCFT